MRVNQLSFSYLKRGMIPRVGVKYSSNRQGNVPTYPSLRDWPNNRRSVCNKVSESFGFLKKKSCEINVYSRFSAIAGRAKAYRF